MLTVLVTLLIGLAAGFAGKALILRDHRGGIMTALVLAITGAMTAGMAGWMMNWFPAESLTSYLASAAGGLLALDIFRWSDKEHLPH